MKKIPLDYVQFKYRVEKESNDYIAEQIRDYLEMLYILVIKYNSIYLDSSEEPLWSFSRYKKLLGDLNNYLVNRQQIEERELIEQIQKSGIYSQDIPVEVMYSTTLFNNILHKSQNPSTILAKLYDEGYDISITSNTSDNSELVFILEYELPKEDFPLIKDVRVIRPSDIFKSRNIIQEIYALLVDIEHPELRSTFSTVNSMHYEDVNRLLLKLQLLKVIYKFRGKYYLYE